MLQFEFKNLVISQLFNGEESLRP